jgi:hypothetical protein
MIIFHTIRLTSMSEEQTVVFDVETKAVEGKPEGVYSVIDDYNKKGYKLTAVNHHDYYLTKRMD